LISVIHIFTSSNVIIEIKNDISTSKKNGMANFEWQPMVICMVWYFTSENRITDISN